MGVVKQKFVEKVGLIFLILVGFIVLNSFKVFAATQYKIIDSKDYAAAGQVWKINFTKDVDSTTVISGITIKVYELNNTQATIPVTCEVNPANNKQIVVTPTISYTIGKSYTIEITDSVKSKSGLLLKNPVKMDFTAKNVFAGLPAENGLVVVDNIAYSIDYLTQHTSLKNDIISKPNIGVYYIYGTNYSKISNFLGEDIFNRAVANRKYSDTITYVDPKGMRWIYQWSSYYGEYLLVQPAIDADVVVGKNAASITVKKIYGFTDAAYFKIEHSNTIKPIGSTIIYTTKDEYEPIYILKSDKSIIAKSYLDLTRTNKGLNVVKLSSDSEHGNYAGNLNNNGILAEDDDGYIYYVNNSNSEKMYKVGLDGLYNRKICEDKAQYINVSQGWIYYSNYTDQGKLYKVRVDGAHREKICDDKAAYISISDDIIYYSNHSDGGKLYKIKKDASDAKINNDDSIHGNPVIPDYGNYDGRTDEVAYINIVGDWIYYSNFSDGHKPYVVNKDGTYRTKISDEWATNLQVIGDWVYYCSGTGVISKVKKDGTGNIVPINGQATASNIGFHMNVWNNWIYYSNYADKGKLYKIKADGSGQKVKLFDQAVGYINVSSKFIYFISSSGKLYSLPIDADGKTSPKEIGTQTSSDKIAKVDNLKASVDFADVNKSISWIESNYLPEKVAAIMGDNKMQQLVVVWDVDPKDVTVNKGVRTYKGNIIGYDKTITMDLTIPSEMLNDTTQISVCNNNGSNDTVDFDGTINQQSTARRLETGDTLSVYSDSQKAKLLGTAIVGSDRKASLQKLNLDALGKSFWVTVTRVGKAESKVTEVKQMYAPTLDNSMVLDSDSIGIGVDTRDISINGWLISQWDTYNISSLNSYFAAQYQQVYVLPTATQLDMKNHSAVGNNISISQNYWTGSKLVNKDSTSNLMKAGKYDVYVATVYSGKGTADVNGSMPLINEKISNQAAITVTTVGESLPAKPTIKAQKIKGGEQITLDKAPAVGETAWLVPATDSDFINTMKSWKAEDGTSFPISSTGNYLNYYGKLVGDGTTNTLNAPASYPNVDTNYKLFISTIVGNSQPSDNTIVIDNKKPTATLPDSIAADGSLSVKAGEKISVRSDEDSTIYLVRKSDYINGISVDDLNNLVQAKLANKILVRGYVPALIDTSGLESLLNDSVTKNYYAVTADLVGNMSASNIEINIQRDTSALEALVDDANSKITSGMDSTGRLASAVSTAANVLTKSQTNKTMLQSEIDKAYSDLKSAMNSLGITVGNKFGSTISTIINPITTDSTLISIDLGNDSTWISAITGIKIKDNQTTQSYSLNSYILKDSINKKLTLNLTQITQLQKAGSKTIFIEATGYTSNVVMQEITAGTPVKIVMVTSTSGPSTNGGVLSNQPIVKLQDRYSNDCVNYNDIVTVSSNDTSAWTIGGTTQVNAINGVATFSGLTATQASNPTTNSISASMKFSIASPNVSATLGTFTIPK